MAKRKNKNKAPSVLQTSIESTGSSLLNLSNLLKVCRLCETKDGPFLNIFDVEKTTAKRIDELLPFVVTENDDLPNKICFRCSAKVEELHEFVQKCIKTQENLISALGKKGPLQTKSKIRKLWEDKLNETNMSNEDICDAFVKKAMQGIKDLTPELPDDINKKNNVNKKSKKNTIPVEKDKQEQSVKKTRLAARTNIVSKDTIKDKNVTVVTETSETQSDKQKLDKSIDVRLTKDQVPSKSKSKSKSITKNFKSNVDAPMEIANVIKEETKTEIEDENKTQTHKEDVSFDIMDHVCMIKVTGVGTLFQCKLCNRNFFHKDIVLSHGCAKNIKSALQKATNNSKGVTTKLNTSNAEPPKPSSVKYITNTEIRRNQEVNKTLTKSDINTSLESKPPVRATQKHKPGPASKTRRFDDSEPEMVGMIVTPRQPTPPPVHLPPPVSLPPNVIPIELPMLPNLKSRFKLVPGPNNTFQLIEDSNTKNEVQPTVNISPKKKETVKIIETKQSEIIDLEEISDDNPPYPVGLITAVNQANNVKTPATTDSSKASTATLPYSTQASKKQSYTILQTGNPSKLLISTKQQPPTIVDPPKKKKKKSKNEINNDNSSKEPFKVTMEDASHPKDSSFFAFINVDPLLQPSYVLPTDTIIQESQISTSSSVTKEKDKDSKYVCNMCSQSFSREKKLLTHIQSHYNKMDEEDEKRVSKKRTRQS